MSSKLYFDKVEKTFNKKKESILDKYNPDKKYKYRFYIDNSGEHTVELVDSNGKTIIKALYDIAGLYNVVNSTWYWGWGVDIVDKKLVKNSYKVKEFSKFIKNNYSSFNPVEADNLYFRTSSSSFYTSLPLVTELVKLALHLTDSIWFIAVCDGKDNTTFIYNKNETSKLGSIKIIKYILIKKIVQL